MEVPPGCCISGAYHLAVTPILLAGLGLAALLAGRAVLSGFGAGVRIGRSLGSARPVTIAEARVLARSGERRYVLVRGRVDADEPFEDERHRPLVLRRDRTETGDRRGWRTLREERRHVPFVLQEGLDAIAVDTDALDDGLVVLPSETEGPAEEVAGLLEGWAEAAGPLGARVRRRIEQVSAVEHACAAGVPVLGPDGEPLLGAGLGRPLILTTLELPDAMRLLGGGRRLRAALAAGLLAVGLGCLALAIVLAVIGWIAPAAALAASPEPSPIPGGDTRSEGEGAGLVGSPVLAAVAVLVLGAVTAGAAVIYARLARD